MVISPELPARTVSSGGPRKVAPAIAVLSPIVTAGLALAVHCLIPDNQEILLSSLRKLPAWQHPYCILTLILGALSVVAAVGQWAWRPLQSWVRHYAPLLAGLL